jgi:hydroxymethylglutaryl-CoA lyase
MRNLPKQVKIVEVGPRDGLQNEPTIIPAAVKIELIERLAACGFQTIEATSFVSPKWVPQLADAADVYATINKKDSIAYPVLVPNLKGLQKAIELDVKEIAVFTAASDSFNQKNINATIDESFVRLEPVIKKARQENINVRGYVSCVLGCPYEGEIDEVTVAEVSKRLFDLGCYEISLGDTIGAGTPVLAQDMIDAVNHHVPLTKLAVHFHDTRGQALANILASLQMGITTIDSSIAGLGGCPYAHGASGNVASEDLIYMLEGMGIETGIDLEKVLDTSLFISKALGKEPASKLGKVEFRKIN